MFLAIGYQAATEFAECTWFATCVAGCSWDELHYHLQLVSERPMSGMYHIWSSELVGYAGATVWNSTEGIITYMYLPLLMNQSESI